MTARISMYRKAEDELRKLDRSIKGAFIDFCHKFRENPDHPGLDLRPLKGERRVFRAKLNDDHRVLLAKSGVTAGLENWLVIAVRHRKHVYEELSVAINRINGEIEFVDLAVVGESVLRRAGIKLTPAEPEAPVAVVPAEPEVLTEPLLTGVDADVLRELGVADQLIDLALAVGDEDELHQLITGAPELSKDVLYGLAAGMSVEEVRREVTAPVERELAADYPDDFGAALERTKVTTVDDTLRAVLEEGSFRDWKVYLHQTQERLVTRDYNGPARVSGGPGTGKTIVALHRVRHLAQALPPGHDKRILLTTFTKNLTTDLKARLSSLVTPELLARVDISHIDQLAARVLSENQGTGLPKRRIPDHTAMEILREVITELGERTWDPEFLLEEWDQVILGQSLGTRRSYFDARRAGRGRSLTRPERNQVWQVLALFTARLDKLGVETWGQAAERAARFEIELAERITARWKQSAKTHDPRAIYRDDPSGVTYRRHRYQHVVVDEAQDLRAAHWKMLRAMVEPGVNDMFIAGDTHQRIYDHQVTLGTVGVNIRGRSARLTLSYRTTREILAQAVGVVRGVSYDDLDDGTDQLDGYRSVLRGPKPEIVGAPTWADELAGLTETIRAWLDDGAEPGTIAVCVAERDRVTQVGYHLAHAGITCAELSKDGPQGDGVIHIGTMHRFKGLEYRRLAIADVRDGVLPRSGVARLERTDPARYAAETRKARSLLFVAATRARDALRISYHGTPSPYLHLPE